MPRAGNRAADEALVLVAYADLMRTLQVLEFGLWQIQAARLKPGMTEAQAYEKVAKWDGTTFGSLLRGMKGQSHWPSGLVEELEWAVEERNHLAHHFLREYFLVKPSRAAFEKAIAYLTSTAQRLEELDSRMDAHLMGYTGANSDDLDPETRASIEAMRPTSWPI